jgi:hypothetical protein
VDGADTHCMFCMGVYVCMCMHLIERMSLSSKNEPETCIAQDYGRPEHIYGRNIYTVHIRYFWQGSHQIYGHIRCIYTVLPNPTRLWLAGTVNVHCVIGVFLAQNIV